MISALFYIHFILQYKRKREKHGTKILENMVDLYFS